MTLTRTTNTAAAATSTVKNKATSQANHFPSQLHCMLDTIPSHLFSLQQTAGDADNNNCSLDQHEEETMQLGRKGMKQPPSFDHLEHLCYPDHTTSAGSNSHNTGGGHNPNPTDLHHQYEYRPQLSKTSTTIGTLDLNVSFTTNTTTIPNNNKSVTATTAPSSGITKKFQVLMEPTPIGLTPSLIIIDKNNNGQHQGQQQVVVSTGGTTPITSTTTKQRVPTSPLGRGTVPSVVLYDIDDGSAQAFTDEDIVVNGNEDDTTTTINVALDLNLEDWTKGVVYEGEDIDICGGTDQDQDQDQDQNTTTQIMINDDPIPFTAAASSLTTVVMGSPIKQTLSQSQSQFQLQQQQQRIQQQRIQQLQQLQQRVQQEQQSRVVQQQAQQQ